MVLNLADKSEVLPEIARDFNFRLTARDNNPNGGGVDFDDINFKSTADAGPFLVTFPNLPETFEIGQEIEILWEVANTDISPVNCSHVDLILSSDGGSTFDKYLLRNSPNDGSEKIIIPNIISDDARIMIKGRDHIFYDISNFSFKIIEPTSSGFYFELSEINEAICLPNEISIDIQTSGFQGFDEPISFEVLSGLPDGATYSFEPKTINPDESTTLNIDLKEVSKSGFYNIKIIAMTDSQDEIIRSLSIETIYNQFDDLMTIAPADGIENIDGITVFEWTSAVAAESYNLQVATNPSFDQNVLMINESNIQNTQFTPNSLLANNEIYYWRVAGSNRCTDHYYSETAAFHTVALNCEVFTSSDTPTNISASGTRTIESKIEVFENGNTQDINVKKVKGNHEQVSDLKMTLISPQELPVILVDRVCGNLANFDLGFDDASPLPLDCPITGGSTFKPVESLSTLANQNKQGTWTLKIEDLSPGFGGVLNEFSLELCADQVLSNPFIVNNLELEIPPGFRDQINSDLLLSDDLDNTADELSYTLVKNTVSGQLTVEDAVISVGDQFTQTQINNRKFKYQHHDNDAIVDSFKFTVQDPVGGWIGITNFNIKIDESFSSTISDLSHEIGLKIYPNPAHKLIYIEVDETDQGLEVSLYDLSGRKLKHINNVKNELNYFEVSNFASGIYFLKVKYMNKIGTQKIFIQHR